MWFAGAVLAIIYLGGMAIHLFILAFPSPTPKRSVWWAICWPVTATMDWCRLVTPGTRRTEQKE